MTRRTIHFWLALWLVAFAIAVPSGCMKSDQIERYTVEKPAPFESTHGATGVAGAKPAGEPKDRTLAAIVPHGGQGWFFKLTGPKDVVASYVDVFATLLKSVHFSAAGKPEWTLPSGWEQRPGSEIRYATLVIPAEAGPLELTVTALAKPPGDDENYALVNVNRWRNQLQLPPIAREQLAAESTRIELDGATATMVDLLGTAAPNAMGRPPFFPGATNGN